jgi:hypothetical protein
MTSDALTTAITGLAAQIQRLADTRQSDFALTPAAPSDEDPVRTARLDSLGVLLSRILNGLTLTTDEATLLIDHVDTEVRESTTARTVAAGNKRHVQTMYADLVQAQKDRDDSDEAARRAMEQRQEMAEERYAWQERGDQAEAALALAREAVQWVRRNYPGMVQVNERLATALDAPGPAATEATETVNNSARTITKNDEEQP